jgi:hypothetical protein
VLAPIDDELPMGVVTHLSPVQTPMIATSHEEISGTSGMMDEPSVRDAHHGQVDPQIQEEVLLRFGYLGKWSPCAYESLSTKGEYFYPHTLLYDSNFTLT